jgi:hypothetical protein
MASLIRADLHGAILYGADQFRRDGKRKKFGARDEPPAVLRDFAASLDAPFKLLGLLSSSKSKICADCKRIVDMSASGSFWH